MIHLMWLIAITSLALIGSNTFAGDYQYCVNKTKSECSSKCPSIVDDYDAYEACVDRCTERVLAPCFSGAAPKNSSSSTSGRDQSGSSSSQRSSNSSS